jgi:hypothetical protein
MYYLLKKFLVNPNPTLFNFRRLAFSHRAGPGVSPASPWARATPLPRATTEGKKIVYINNN